MTEKKRKRRRNTFRIANVNYSAPMVQEELMILYDHGEPGNHRLVLIRKVAMFTDDERLGIDLSPEDRERLRKALE